MANKKRMEKYKLNTFIRNFDILLVHTKNSELSNGIQNFQKLEDEEAGHYNHSAIFLWIGNNLFVVEADFLKKGNEKTKLRAAVVVTPFDDYLKRLEHNEVELLHLAHKSFDINYDKGVYTLMQFEGRVYDYKNFISQIYRTIRKAINKNWKPKKVQNADAAFICHELTQRFYNIHKDYFPNWSTANVSPIFRNKKFAHTEIEIKYENIK